MPSIHSSVSTSLAVRSQSTVGTRKSGSSSVFSAISDSAAASSRRSISIATERRSVSTTSIRPQPARFGGEALGRFARGEREGIEIDGEAPLDAGPQHLDRDRRGRPRSGRDAPARSRRRRPRAERGEDFADRPAERASRPWPRPPPAGTAPSCPAALARSRAIVDADDVRPRRQELARASRKSARAASSAAEQPRGPRRCDAAAGRAISCAQAHDSARPETRQLARETERRSSEQRLSAGETAMSHVAAAGVRASRCGDHARQARTPPTGGEGSLEPPAGMQRDDAAGQPS